MTHKYHTTIKSRTSCQTCRKTFDDNKEHIRYSKKSATILKIKYYVAQGAGYVGAIMTGMGIEDIDSRKMMGGLAITLFGLYQKVKFNNKLKKYQDLEEIANQD